MRKLSNCKKQLKTFNADFIQRIINTAMHELIRDFYHLDR